MEITELLNLPYEEYMMQCYRLLNKNQDILNLDMASVSFMEALWMKRYWQYKNGEYDVED